MGVTVAASCAFLIRIGHKNNTFIMGPGSYRFGDYWRMGLPLGILDDGILWPFSTCQVVQEMSIRRMDCLKLLVLKTAKSISIA